MVRGWAERTARGAEVLLLGVRAGEERKEHLRSVGQAS